nr:YetF domain-containing protein [Caproicibacter fermentans]
MKFRKAVNSEPLVLIENGQIVEPNLKKSRITLNDLTSLLREKNAFNIADVNNAVLENDGKLSVQLKSGKKPVTPSQLQLHPPEKGLTRDIVIDGVLLSENLEATNLTKEWLYEELKKQGISNLGEVFFAALDSSGSLYVSKGMKGKEQPGQHGIE